MATLSCAGSRRFSISMNNRTTFGQIEDTRMFMKKVSTVSPLYTMRDAPAAMGELRFPQPYAGFDCGKRGLFSPV